MVLFMDFHQGVLPLSRLNFGNIILLLKKKDVRVIQQYRPICLLNVSFKIFTKVATNRLSTIAQKIIRPIQTAFLPGRNIMEGAVILLETLHELHTKKQDGVIFKIDFEKAYDKVKWSFFTTNIKNERVFTKNGMNGWKNLHRGAMLISRSTINQALTSRHEKA
jgi:mannosylglycoprotein endo-beta-mannosidase